MQKNSYKLTPEAETAALKMFTEMYEERDENFGNGRDVRNCFEDMIVRQANRVAAMEDPTKDDLIAVLPEDFLEPEEIEAMKAMEEMAELAEGLTAELEEEIAESEKTESEEI